MMLEKVEMPPSHRHQLLKQNNPVPKNSSRYSSSFGQATSALYGSRFSLSYSLLPAIPHTSAVSISAYAHGRIEDALPMPDSLFAAPIRETHLQGSSGVDHNVLFPGISGSTPMILAFPFAVA
jgi:hypothetical protein